MAGRIGPGREAVARMASELSAEDTIALHQLCGLYGQLVDDRRFDDLRLIFTDDVEFDASAFGNPPLWGIGPVILSYEAAAHPVAHHVTNVYAFVDDDGTVRVRSKVISLLSGGVCGSGTYDDVAVRTPAGWRIARRIIGLRRERDLPVPPPPPARPRPAPSG
jgi:hypothetical protein